MVLAGFSMLFGLEGLLEDVLRANSGTRVHD